MHTEYMYIEIMNVVEKKKENVHILTQLDDVVQAYIYIENKTTVQTCHV